MSVTSPEAQGPRRQLSAKAQRRVEGVRLLAVIVVVMWIVDAMKARWEKAGQGASGSTIKTWKMENMSLGQSIWIGACQILSAVFPGTSRSMATIAGGQLAGMSRASALEFSFFLSMPTMVVATGYALLKSVMGKGVENPIGDRANNHPSGTQRIA